MITGLDHVVALVKDIGAAKAAYQTLLGRAPAWQNSGEGADRVLFTLENMTIELMAPSNNPIPNSRRLGLKNSRGKNRARTPKARNIRKASLSRQCSKP